MKKIRLLKPEEIEIRMSDKTKSGKVHMLLYIDSRKAVNLLDECYGTENWNLEYKEVAGQIYGRISIWDGEKQRYFYREDTGEEAKISSDKSLASDILKRLISRLGVTELYSAPKIYLEDDGYGNTGYKVSSINYNDNREIIQLTIVDKFGKQVFNWDAKSKINENYTAPAGYTKPDKSDRLVELEDFCIKEKENENTDIEELRKFYKYYTKPSQVNPDVKVIDNFKIWNVNERWNKWMSKKIN